MSVFDKLNFGLQSSETPKSTFDNIAIIHHWPSDRWIPGQAKVTLEPNHDPVLAQYLTATRRQIQTAPPQFWVNRAIGIVHKGVPYNDDNYRKRIHGPNYPVSELITNGGTCSSKALILHLVLANCGIASNIRLCTGIDHGTVEVPLKDGTSIAADPTWYDTGYRTSDLNAFFQANYNGPPAEKPIVCARPVNQISL